MKPKVFLQRLAGSNPKILARPECGLERTKHETVGLTVLLSGAMAFASGMAVTATFTPILPIAVLGGTAWAISMLTVDRALLTSIDKSPSRSPLTVCLQVAPRLLLSVVSSTLVSMPLEQAIFHQEISRKIAEIDSVSEQTLRDRLIVKNPEMVAIQNQINTLENDLRALHKERSRGFKDGIAEAEGSGGSGKAGKGELYAEKMAYVEELEKQITAKQKTLSEYSKRLNALIDQNNSAVLNVASRTSDGLLARARALDQLKQEDPAVRNLVRFVGLLIMGLETAPLAAKLFSNPGVYESIISSEEDSSKGFYETEAHVLRHLRETEFDERIKNIRELTQLIHNEAAKRYPSILEAACKSEEFRAIEKRIMAEMVSRLESLMEQFVAGVKPSPRYAKDLFDEAMARYDQLFPEVASRHAATVHIESVNRSKTVDGSLVDNSLTEDYWS